MGELSLYQCVSDIEYVLINYVEKQTLLSSVVGDTLTTTEFICCFRGVRAERGSMQCTSGGRNSYRCRVPNVGIASDNPYSRERDSTRLAARVPPRNRAHEGGHT